MRPKPLGDPQDHYWQVLKMAAARDVSLVNAFDDGALTQADFAAMIERCRGCTRPAACAQLLTAHERLPDAPDYCENKGPFADLQLD